MMNRQFTRKKHMKESKKKIFRLKFKGNNVLKKIINRRYFMSSIWFNGYEKQNEEACNGSSTINEIEHFNKNNFAIFY